MIPIEKIKKMAGFVDTKNYKEIYRPKKKKIFRFNHCEVGDYVKFKGIGSEDREKMKQGIYVENKYSVYYGRITDVSREDFLEVKLDPNHKQTEFPLGLNFWIDRRAVLQNYPQKLVKHITPRLALKHIWKDLIFREVKTTKLKGLKYVQYNYINRAGFIRIKRFKSYEEAIRNVEPEHHKNISIHYEEYFGFTGDRAIRNNDKYFDKEIFFSKKCYCELDWSDKTPNGDFLINERGFNDIPPRPGALICGLVENGEKGLFFRKWFICSREFLLLWTMVCDPKDPSLMEKVVPKISFEHLQNNEEIKKVVTRVKSFDKLLHELSTSCYKVDLRKDIRYRQQKYIFHNLERAALYYPNRYKKICEIIFSNGFINKNMNDSRSYSEDYQDDYTPFQKKLIRNILWQH